MSYRRGKFIRVEVEDNRPRPDKRADPSCEFCNGWGFIEIMQGVDGGFVCPRCIGGTETLTKTMASPQPGKTEGDE